MMVLLGIDVGTSSVKALILEATSGQTLATAGQEYPIHASRAGWVEQHPVDWWGATVSAVQKTLDAAEIEPEIVAGIGLSGQMHGTVLLDGAGLPVRLAIIWADGRASAEAEVLNQQWNAHPEVLVPGPAVTGFMGPTLKWLAAHEPHTIEAAASILLPKDYVRYQLTGRVATDRTDAAATWLLDLPTGTWSPDLCAWCGIDPARLPTVLDSADIAGTLTASAADQLGLRTGIPVVAGAADQAAQALGHGILHPGEVLVTVGTGGQVFVPLAAPRVDAAGRMHTFSHALPDRWYGLAAILAAGLSLRWLRDTLDTTYESLAAQAGQVAPGADGLVFLPYLAGERTPHMDPSAAGAFVGLLLHHGIGHLARAVMEGVAFALADCLDVAEQLDGKVETVTASGGALISPVWRPILADVFNRPLRVAEGENRAAVGAAFLAGVGLGIYTGVPEAVRVLREPVQMVEPDRAIAAFYDERRKIFRGLYGHLQEDIHRLHR